MNREQEAAQARALEETRRYMNSADGKRSLERARAVNYARLRAENERLDAQREAARLAAARNAPVDEAVLGVCERRVAEQIVRGDRVDFADGLVAVAGAEPNLRTREELTRRTKIALSLKRSVCELCAGRAEPQTCTEMCPDFVIKRCTKGGLCHKLHGCERLEPRSRRQAPVPRFYGPSGGKPQQPFAAAAQPFAAAAPPQPFRSKWRD